MAAAMVLVGCTGGSVGSSADDFRSSVDLRMVELMERYQVPGAAVAILADGDLAFVRTYGMARGTDEPMTREAVNHVGSISKPVTAWGVMTLVEDGAIDLDAPVSAYLETWQFPDDDPRYREITVRQLLDHTSGLTTGTIGIHYEPDGDVPSLRETLSAETALVRDPGSGFAYSNVGFNLLELLVEEVSGESFESYMKREVLAPLGMESATFAWDSSFDPLIPYGHDLDGFVVAPYVYPEKGSGGLFATIDDIASFVAASMLNGPEPGRGVIGEATLRAMYEPSSEVSGIYRVVTAGYGLGYFVEALQSGPRAVWHGGQGHGWMTHFHAIPESGDGIVILTNSQRSWPLFSEILGDWARWMDTGPVGMNRIGTITAWVMAVVVVLGMAVAAQLARVSVGLVTGGRAFAVPSTRTTIVLVLSALPVLVAAAIWIGDPLYVRAVFPLVWPWVGVTLFGTVAALLLTATTASTRR